MKSTLSMLALALALVILLGGANSARADGDGTGGRTASLPFAAKAMDDSMLETQRGGADHTLSDIRSYGSVADVTTVDAVTGYNVVREGSVTGNAGMPLLIQNSGNGVLIQNAVILNVQVQ
ncbi:hypothetical protein ACDA63_18960 [Uliginosibacterium sp. sgz301328]|uniref:hypothetical protein n=1 Tax=Uliginosibacterium sp. sgz301328 TaxID=3243764 RepID=UPI00359DA721